MTERKPMQITRYFSKHDTNPYDEIEWDYRDIDLMGSDGSPVFHQDKVKSPRFWSDTAVTIAAQKYFRGAFDSENREQGIDELIGRVVDTIADWGVKDGYLDEESGKIFRDELAWLNLNQFSAFNSPVWFNVGVDEEPQCSACFILQVQDKLESILQLAHTEAMIFRGGSGSGINFSSLRSSREPLSGGGIASGPVSFMRGFDAFAGVIKSGGKTRRAAKMIILNATHPDIHKFIDSKLHEEEKAKALIKQGYDGSFDGEAYSSVFFQNANHSVRVEDDFMQSVINDEEIDLVGVSNNKSYETLKARDLWKEISDAAHKCGDPGLQFDTTINKWHTCPQSGRINASNPCSEFMFLDESACNLASLNLLKFLDKDGKFNIERFTKAAELFILAMDIIVDRAGYPTEKIKLNSSKYRPLGIGYTNLGGLLMSLGIPYDSDLGREYAGAITALMSGASYALSAKLARDVTGTFSEFEKNRDDFNKVMDLHSSNLSNFTKDEVKYIVDAAKNKWTEAIEMGREFGYRNSQVSLLAPTGTIGFLMDSDSTGIEPMVALLLYKRLVGGGTLKLITKSVLPALHKLNYSESQISEILQYLEANGTVEGSPGLKEEHLAVFDTALRPSGGTRTISYMAHLKMMAAVQPFLSGAISKTVNLPKDTTPEEIFDIYIKAWKLGLKSVAIYREGSKGTEPLSTSPESEEATEILAKHSIVRRKLPDERLSITHKFEVGGHEGYFTVGYYKDGKPGEIFIAMAKEGSTISGLMDAFAIAISVALQHGVPLDLFCSKYMHSRFEPSGITANGDIPMASSLIDYIFRWLDMHHVDGRNPTISNLAINATNGHNLFDVEPEANFGNAQTNEVDNLSMGDYVSSSDAPICPDCGFVMVRNGSCYKCMNCGSTSGCS